MKKNVLIVLGTIALFTAVVFIYNTQKSMDEESHIIQATEQQEINGTTVIETTQEETSITPTIAPEEVKTKPSVSTYTLVDTAQSSCYDKTISISCPTSGSFFGQDAQYQGNAPSYQDNGDGTITDTNTNLMWAKATGEKMTYTEAVDIAKEASLAGYTDWRIPTIKELYSLMDFRGIDPSAEDESDENLTPFIDTTYFTFAYGDISDGSRIIDSQWITSNIYKSTVMNNQECFFGVNFADGRIKCYPTRAGGNQGYFLRLVRGNTSYGVNKFTDNKDGTVSDTATGLIWQKSDSKNKLLWSDALAYCEALVLGGEHDWRLPNIKELQSIVDYTRSPDTTNSPALNPVFSATQITNEAGQKDWGYYWSGTTHVSHVNAQAAAYISFGGALGNMSEFGGWIDVHGAGAQRSDPKEGVPDGFENGHGPQGDAVRSYNFARCVRGGAVHSTDTQIDTRVTNQVSEKTLTPTPPEPEGKTPPAEAQEACDGKKDGAVCAFSTPQDTVQGVCRTTSNQIIACIP